MVPLPTLSRDQKPKVGVTICVLLYGDYLELASRCLNSILPNDGIPVIVGMNACSEATGTYVEELRKRFPTQVSVVKSATNIHKYPMMRRMFYGPGSAIRTTHVAWFDDDSYLTASVADWNQHVSSRFGEFELLGSVYTQPLQGCQADWIEDQPWYRGQSVRVKATDSQRQRRQRPNPYRVRFVTGGYWVATMQHLRMYDWPWPQRLDHNGGDVMLGEMYRQQNLRVVHDKYGVAINADRDGRESKAVRRGYTSRPIGFDYDRSAAGQVLDRYGVGKVMDVPAVVSTPPAAQTPASVAAEPTAASKPQPFELEL